MASEAQPLSRLAAKQQEQTPQALARLVVVSLFIVLWFFLWLLRIPMPVPFLAVLVVEALFFLLYWRTVFVLPTIEAVDVAQYVMLAAEIAFHTTMVYFLGGISWLGPFAYVFGLIFANTFLDLRRGFIYTGAACTAFTSLILLQAAGIIPHYPYPPEGAIASSSAQIVATTIIGGVGVFFSIYLWVNWVGYQLQSERDAALRAQDDLLQARTDLQRANVKLEARVRERTAELELANAALGESEQRLRTLITNAPVVLFALDREGTFTLAEGKGLGALGLKPQELIGQSIFTMYRGPMDLTTNVRSALDGRAVSATVELASLTLETHCSPVHDDRGEVAGVIVTAIDVTERKHAEEALRVLARFPSESPDPVLQVGEDGTIIYANQRSAPLLSLWGCQVGEPLPSGWQPLIAEALASGAGKEADLVCGDRTFSVTFAPITDARSVYVYARDITDRRLAEEELREQARHDPLTGLLNRGAGLSTIQERFDGAKYASGRFAVIVLNLDKFRELNDSHGYEAGDTALIDFAQTIGGLTSAAGVICRLGGVEFAIGLDGAGVDEALAFSQELHASLRRPPDGPSEERRPKASVSIGIACYPEDGDSVAELARRADQALAAAKAAGGDTVRAYRHLTPERQVA